ncbi:Mce protein [Mycolicibacterium holsaticum]|uniref:Mce protein n=1 Tax=Mycolicibacterium holsaticum TaxID=152142 RepID=UPI001C7D713B|nr:Mce protein [Mycolicibacterium holsaticum]QZA11942.1 Mce protein [Mycolicibacterium holsaticum DSM 44478 = JCM 12374]UNC10570.1 Mce protein [Mycolicibacterium holsaticum DSM 44478 = JCM 12374]
MSVSTDEDRETGEEPDEGDAAKQAEAPDTTEDSGAAPAAPNWRRRALRAAVAAAFVVLAAAVGFLGWQLWQERQITQAGEQARQAATDYAQVLTSIDSEKVDENFDAVLDGATGEFKDMYSQSSSQLRQLLIDNKASAHGVVLESAVQSATKDKAVVLLFVDQSVSNTNVPDPRIDRSRIKMTMEYVDGRWRASKVELP